MAGAIALLDPRPYIEPTPELPKNPPSRRGALIALAFIVLLIAGGLFLQHVLHEASKLQDCVMQGRTNCAPVDPGAPNRP